MIEWNETDSSNISRFGYDEVSYTLTIEFRNGSLYDYFDVPIPVYELMKSAPSKGRFLVQEIKGNYRYARR